MCDDDEPEFTPWNEEPEPIYKLLGWGCLLVLLLPFLPYLFSVLLFLIA